MLLSGLLLYDLGFEFEILGLSVLVYARTGSSAWAAAAFSAGFLPQAAGGALFTSLADRMPPRLVIAVGLVVRALPGLAIGLLPQLPSAAMLGVVAVAAMVTPTYLAAMSALLPDVLSGDQYILGRSIFSTTASGTQILGLGLGGAVLAGAAPRWLLLAAGVALTLAAVVTRLGLRHRPARVGAGGWRIGTVVRATGAGNAELFRLPAVRDILLVQWLPAWCCTGAEALIVPYAVSRGHPASAASALLAAMPAGMLIGDLAVARFCPPDLRARLVLPLALLVGLPLAAFSLHLTPVLAGVALFLAGVGCAYPLGLQRAFLDSVPARLRGQGFGLAATGSMGGQGLLPSAFGVVASVVGPAGAIALAGAAAVVAVAGVYPRLRRRLATAGGL